MSLVRIVKLRVPAGSAKPGPAIGQALGPLGINMMEFCKAFNAATEKLVPDTPIPVRLNALSNRTFTFTVKTPPTSWFLKRCAGVAKGANRPGHQVAGKVTMKQIYEIAKIKHEGEEHLKHLPLKSVCRTIMGSAQSMGLEVVSGLESAEAESTTTEEKSTENSEDDEEAEA